MKRATVYFDETVHRALRLKSAEVDRSISDFVNEAVRAVLNEDLEDLEAVQKRGAEKTVAYADFLRELKARGQL